MVLRKFISFRAGRCALGGDYENSQVGVRLWRMGRTDQTDRAAIGNGLAHLRCVVGVFVFWRGADGEC